MRNSLATLLFGAVLLCAGAASAQAIYLYVPIDDPDTNFRVDQKMHDAWVNRANTRCRREFETVRAQHACMGRLRAESERRQCEVFRRLDWRRSRELGIDSDIAERNGCPPIARWGGC
ncbi:MAG: hypothetical protein ACQGVC_24225 [Myxococcota bacterium]